MSTLNSAQFEQDVQDNGISPMDTTPITQAVNATFLASVPTPSHSESALQAQILQASQLFIDKSDPSANSLAPMHISMPELTSPTFISSMDALDATAPSIHPTSAAFVADFAPHTVQFGMVQPIENSMSLELSSTNHTLSASPPQSQIPSPAMQSSNSSYTVGVTSSLESALDPTGVSTGRSRASTSVSPPVNPIPFPQIPIATQQSLPITFSTTEPALTESIDPVPPSEPHRLLVPLLKQ